MRRVPRRRQISMPLIVPVLILGLVVLACGKSSPPVGSPQVPVSVKPSEQAAKKDTVPDEEISEQKATFRYNPTDHRDPFASLLRVKKVRLQVSEEELTPLQRVSLSDVTLGGIVILGKKAYAQVIAPDGKAHTISVGTLIGRNGGKVKRITSNEVVVEEEFEDYIGRPVKQETVLKLREKEGESS